MEVKTKYIKFIKNIEGCNLFLGYFCMIFLYLIKKSSGGNVDVFALGILKHINAALRWPCAIFPLLTGLFVSESLPGAPAKPMENKGFHLQKNVFLGTKNKVFDGFRCSWYDLFGIHPIY